MIGLWAAMALLAGGQAAPECSVQRLDACPSTNELVWSSSFEPAVETFLERASGHYVFDGPLIDQQIAVLGGPPDAPVRVGEFYRFTACRAHSCPEKGVAVFSASGEIQLLGILHSACLENPRPEACYARVRLTVFTRQLDVPSVISENVEVWARAAVADAYNPPGLPPHEFEGVAIIRIP